MTDQAARKRKFSLIITAYPVVLILISTAVNVLIFGSRPVAVDLPSVGTVGALIFSGALLVLNHTWLMTATELTRLRFGMYATHEEWAENGVRKADVDETGWIELERHHNAHRNATENTVPFAFLAILVCLAAPAALLAQVWTISFAVARLGYTYGALRGRSGVRQLSMTLSLLALYGLADGLVLGLLV